MKHNYLILTAIAFVMGLALAGCKKDTPENVAPKIIDDKVEVTMTSATFTWTVDWPGKIISVVEVSENEDMSEAMRFGSEEELNKKTFLVTANNLKPATKYYYHFMVWNQNYIGNEFIMETKWFTTTTEIPKVKAQEVTDVTRISAVVICEVTDECGSIVTERGVCWSTNHNPTIDGSHASNGTGLGIYSVAVSNLEAGKAYYVRAYAKNNEGTAYSENELCFTTSDAVIPTVTTTEITNIDWRTAIGGGEVTDDGDATVTERGICWSMSPNPTISDYHANNGSGIGIYSVNMTSLTAGTTYYVRAYAKNMAGVGYGNEVLFETKEPELPTVITGTVTNVTWFMATGGGDVTSDGGSEVIERGICWSKNQNPTIADNYTNSGSGTGAFSATITGLMSSTQYYVCAFAKNSKGIRYGEAQAFTTSENNAPEGAIFGIFTVNSNGGRVWFSQGNLQYRANDNKWRFAEHQWDYVGYTDYQGFHYGNVAGSSNNYISSDYNGWIDLFGWATSGYDHGAQCYQPWSTEQYHPNYYYAYGSSSSNLFNQTGLADWGYNPISNGGDTEGQWRTLTSSEWSYILLNRNTPSGIRFALAKVNDVNGLIILPDAWDANIYDLKHVNQYYQQLFSYNIIDEDNWMILENAGAVFLPSAGCRIGTDVSLVNTDGRYWSGNYSSNENSSGVKFHSNMSNSFSTTFYRFDGLSVRLVRNVGQ